MKMTKYQWLLFDADGTLFDYNQAEAGALTKTFVDAGYEPAKHYLTTYRQINAQLWLDFEKGLVTQAALKDLRFIQLFAALDLKDDAPGFGDRYLINLGNRIDLIDGAFEIINTLSRAYHLQLVTNGIKEVQRSRLRQSQFKDLFDSVIISGEISVAKPNSRFFEIAFAAMGNPQKEEVLIIGDSLTSDILGGRNFGIDTCWFNPTRQPLNPEIHPTYMIDNLGELLPILGE